MEGGERERTGGGVGVNLDAVELLHLVVDLDEERDVDGERDERDERREEGEQGRDELHGDVRAQGRQEREERDAGRCSQSQSRHRNVYGVWLTDRVDSETTRPASK